MVRLKGFEPPTYWFVASHSIQLSYSRLSLPRKISLTAKIYFIGYSANCQVPSEVQSLILFIFLF